MRGGRFLPRSFFKERFGIANTGAFERDVLEGGRDADADKVALVIHHAGDDFEFLLHPLPVGVVDDGCIRSSGLNRQRFLR